MKARIKLFATLQKGRFNISDLELEEGTTVFDIIRMLNIDEKDAAIIFINGIHGGLDSVIKEGDDVAVFPPIGGG